MRTIVILATYVALVITGAARSAESIQVLLPESEVLVTHMTLPVSAEIFSLRLSLPTLSLILPLAGRDLLETRLWSAAGSDLNRNCHCCAPHSRCRCRVSAWRSGRRRHTFGLSAEAGSAVVTLDGYRIRLLTPYLKNLRQFALRSALAMVGITFLAVTPAIWSFQTAQQYSAMLAETEQRSSAVVVVRGALVQAQERVSQAERFFSEHASYRPWLQVAAHSRLGLSESAVDQRGCADSLRAGGECG